MEFKNIVPGSNWESIFSEYVVKSSCLILVIGDIDTGKTLLCQYLLYRLLYLKKRVYFIDSDIGQSTITPPSTVGLKRLNSYVKDIENVKPDKIYFVGSVSPRGHLLQLLTSIKLAVEECNFLKNRNYILIDTTGLVRGNIGNELKIQKIKLIKPHFLIAIQKNKELEPILKNFYDSPHINIKKVSPSCRVKVKNRKQREINRQCKFKAYFEKSNLHKLKYKNLGLCGQLHNFNKLRRVSLERRLIGLNHKEGNTVGLAIVQKIDYRRKLMHIITPVNNLSGIKSLIFGSIRLNRDYTTEMI